jgi:hypothetical protein
MGIASAIHRRSQRPGGSEPLPDGHREMIVSSEARLSCQSL